MQTAKKDQTDEMKLATEKAFSDRAARLVSGPAMTAQERAYDDRRELGRKRAQPLEVDLGSRYSYERTRFETFQVYHANQREAFEKVKAFADAVTEHTAAGRGLILFGTVGTGKDHLMASALYAAALRAAIPCRFYNAQDIYGRMRDRMDDGRSEDSLLRELTTPRILALSDPMPPAGDLSAWRLETLYRLVNRRYHNMRPTWMTINAKSREDIDDKLSSQVWDRLQETAEVIACFWPSYRERKP